MPNQSHGSSRNRKGRQSAPAASQEFFNPRLRLSASRMSTTEKEVAGDSTRVLMTPNMLYGNDRLKRMRSIFPTLTDNALSRAPKRFLLPTNLRNDTNPLTSVTPTQIEKLDAELLTKRREEEGMSSHSYCSFLTPWYQHL